MKPGKGNSIILFNKKDYTISRGNHFFQDTKKFKCVKSDPTTTRMKTLQIYLSKLHKQNELTKEEYNVMKPKNGKLARANALLKIYKEYSNIPKFGSFIKTTGKPHYSAGRFLKILLNSLPMNKFTLNDSFDAVNKTKNIPPHLFDNRCNFKSFDVVSLFTNVPIKRTIDIIHKRIYIDKVISTNLKKHSMKNLLLNVCFKKAFTFNGVSHM